MVQRRQWQPTPVLLPGKFLGQRSLEGCSSWCRWGLDTTEQLHFHSSLSCIGEGNSNPLQFLCLENPRDGGAWWAAIYGVSQSWTRLKWLSSSSNIWLIFLVNRLGPLECTEMKWTTEKPMTGNPQLKGRYSRKLERRFLHWRKGWAGWFQFLSSHDASTTKWHF